MFWDHVAGVYDVFVNVINRKAHQNLKRIVSVSPRIALAIGMKVASSSNFSRK